jgi:hypothetical protein
VTAASSAALAIAIAILAAALLREEVVSDDNATGAPPRISATARSTDPLKA